ncbi:MAG: ABC transporter substrate-binding protein [Fretibacterium sp.]|nr:ABC transporter substrate-binding protein [Fretibacterium sp.]
MRKSTLKILLGAALCAGLLAGRTAAGTKYPVTINNGNREVTFEAAPKRVVTNCDSNIIELMFALGLEDRLAGYAGFPEYGNNVSPEYREKLKAIPIVTPGYITLEPLLKAGPDLFLSGYNYGLDIPAAEAGGAVTPDELEKHGIKSYAITESLIRVMKKPPVSLEDTYTDLTNLGIIFDVQDRAQKVIQDMRARVAAVEAKLADVKREKTLEVFIYPTWNAPDQPPRSNGAQAMPSALVKMAKGHNIFSDVDDSWIRVTWEDVIARNPDVILILETGTTSGPERKALIQRDPALQGVQAVKDGRIYVIRVEDAYPGPRAVHGLELIARAFYPELFN